MAGNYGRGIKRKRKIHRKTSVSSKKSANDIVSPAKIPSENSLRARERIPVESGLSAPLCAPVEVACAVECDVRKQEDGTMAPQSEKQANRNNKSFVNNIYKPVDKMVVEVHKRSSCYGTSGMDIDEMLFSPNPIAQSCDVSPDMFREKDRNVGRVLDSRSSQEEELLQETVAEGAIELDNSLPGVDGGKGGTGMSHKTEIKNEGDRATSGAMLDYTSAENIVRAADDDAKIAESSENLVGTDFPASFEDGFLDGVYPEDFSFSLDLSVHTTAPAESHQSMKSTTTNGPIDTVPKHISEGKLLPVKTEAGIGPSTHPQQEVDSIHISPACAVASSLRIPSSSPPLLPLDTSELRFLQTPSPNLPGDLHTSTPFKPHGPSFAEAMERVEYPVNTFYGLPILVLTLLQQHRGIQHLYEWQHDCLSLRSVYDGCNLLYSLPTSGGKTLVAELIIFRQLILNNKNALFILPFVSIVQEKVRELLPFANELGFAVEEYAANKGCLPPRKRRKRTVYVATIEKANSLVNSLIELDRLNELGLCIVDELHMLGDGTLRGATLEACVAKIQFAAKGGIQMVGMSATLSNIAELAGFLNAQVYTSSFRPVMLTEYVKLGRSVFRVSQDGADGSVVFFPEREVSHLAQSSPQASAQLQQLDPDQLCSLVAEVLPSESCLVFCPTKKNCQNVAVLLSTGLSRCAGGMNFSEECIASRKSLLHLLAVEASGVCPVLRQTIPWGVAYHHSGLTGDERKVIEEGYLNGTLSVLACTSTLAAGVNLPAKRVVLRSPYISNQLLSRSQYKQMVGRAGRSGLCATGESVLVLREKDKAQVTEILSGPCENCGSSLLVDNCAALLSLLLSLIGLKLIKNFHQLWEFMSFTLLSLQTPESSVLKECLHRSVEELVCAGYVTREAGMMEDNHSFFITSLGRACYKGSLPVKTALVIYDELKEACQSLVLTSDLHLLYLATPPDLGSSEHVQPNWMVYFEKVTGFGADELQVAAKVGVKPGILAKKATGTAEKMAPTTTSVYSRFYLTVMLYCLMKMECVDAIWRVAHTFGCPRGFLQTLLTSASSFTSCLVHFTQEIPIFWSLSALLPAVGKKLSYSSRLELVPLMEISGLKQGRARQLVAIGVTTPQALAAANPKTLCEEVEHLYPKQARKLISAAKGFLSDQAEALLEEAEELMSALPDSASK